METNTYLFSPLKIRDIQFRNRIGVSPMCMYSSEDGMPNEWHMVHLGSRAIGGAGVVIAEATAIAPNGRISPNDTGLWNDEQSEAWAPITKFMRDQGAVPAIQLAHAGRKAGTDSPWRGGQYRGDLAWDIVGPSDLAFSEKLGQPRELSIAEIAEVVAGFKASAVRALGAGFEVAEIHAAHGYLLNSFMSPLSNHRTDEYGGSFENRTRIVKDVVNAIRSVWPERLPLFIRFSASDWVEGGWDIDQSVRLASELKSLGVDLVDCSSGGNSPLAQIPAGPGYQVPFAAEVRAKAGIATAAVGLITEPSQANDILAEGKADLVLLARESLRDPYWPRRAAIELKSEIAIPDQYRRAW